jgi:hypothetical protein
MKNAQKWLTDKISGEYKDKDQIIEIILFQCLINYVEIELDGKIELDKINSNDSWNKFYAELKENYNIVKNIIPELIEKKRILSSAMTESKDCLSFSESCIDFSEIRKLDDEIEEKTSKILMWVVKNRGFLWT